MDRVLAVDDNPAIQKLVSVNLQARGYAVTAADTGEDALRLYTPGDYDLVLLDLILPASAGLRCAPDPPAVRRSRSLSRARGK
jgi:CheY-like chemotaxis protein